MSIKERQWFHECGHFTPPIMVHTRKDRCPFCHKAHADRDNVLDAAAIRFAAPFKSCGCRKFEACDCGVGKPVPTPAAKPRDPLPGTVIFYPPEQIDKKEFTRINPVLRPALARQEGGGHYKDMAIQPVEYIHKNGLGFIEGSVVKYVSRWRSKGGVEDLKKARHFLDLLIEFESVDKHP